MNDIKIIRFKNTEIITIVKIKLIKVFKMVNMGPISFYLNLKLDKNCQKRTIKLLQLVYIQNILTKYHFNKDNPTNMTMKEVILRLNFFTKATKAER